MHLTLLDPNTPEQDFPPLQLALDEPNGLLAVGGCLSTVRLLNAYRHGIFPWYNPDEPILWWSPNPRLVLLPENLRISHSLRKTLRKQFFEVSFDHAFNDVINACAETRKNSGGTWISTEISQAYIKLYELGIAHSVEAWHDGTLAGGLYGVALGQVFFGESMFHRQTDASKIAFVTLVQKLSEWGYQLVDCQVHTHHLASLGAESITRSHFVKLLEQYCHKTAFPLAWKNV